MSTYYTYSPKHGPCKCNHSELSEALACMESRNTEHGQLSASADSPIIVMSGTHENPTDVAAFMAQHDPGVVPKPS